MKSRNKSRSKMETSMMLVIVSTLSFLFVLSDCGEVKVFVSESGGNDVDNYCNVFEKPCHTLDYAYNKALSNKSISTMNLVLIGSYTLNNSFIINVHNANLSKLKISANDGSTEVLGNGQSSIIIGCENGSECIGYSISIEGLIFRNFNNKPVITAYKAPNVVITNCTFKNNSRTAIEAFDTSFLLVRCWFKNNQSLMPTKGSSHTYNNRTLCSGGVIRFTFANAHYKSINIQSSTFLNNSTSFTEISNCGGALSLNFLEISSHNNVNITSSYFRGNTAYFGGGLSMILSDSASNNSLTISDTDFVRNCAAKSGGGFYVKTFDRASKNIIIFRNVTFRENVAKLSGGAGKLIFENLESEVTKHRFEATRFIENRAEIQAAIGLIKTHRASPITRRTIVVFKDSYFSSNSFLDDSSFIRSGTLSTFHVDIHLTGSNYFSNNSLNSPLYACGSNVKVSGFVSFSENFAYFAGGGISLVDDSKLILMSGSNLTFYKNYASVQGGAIYYQSNLFDNEIIPFNPLCFVQYENRSVAAKDWNITMNFIGNGAGYKGAAIFATTVIQCAWIPVEPYKAIKDVLRWNGRFKYTSNYVGNWKKNVALNGGFNKDTIATDTSRFVENGSTEIEAYPGQMQTIPLTAFDDYNQTVSAFGTLGSFDFWSNKTRAGNSSINIRNKVVYSSASNRNDTKFRFSLANEDVYQLVLKKEMERIHVVDVISYNSIHGTRLKLKVNLTACLPGYRFDSSTLSCVCDHTIEGLTSCHGDTIRIRNGLWANTSQKDENKLVMYDCPKSYCQCRSSEHHRSDCEVNTSQPNHQCQTNRKGWLCGKCKTGSSITLPTYRCRKCEGDTRSILILIAVIIFTISVCIGIIYFNPKLSEYLKGVFFYTQILPYIFTDSESVSASIAINFCTFVNSVAVGSMPIEMCLFKGLDRIDAIGFSYIIPSICAFILAAVYVLGAYRVLNFHRNSPFNAFWVLIIVVFKLLVETSMQSLTCFRVDGDLVFFFDGSVKCFSKEHLALFIPSALILVVLVIPLPVIIVLISFGYVTVPPHVSDIITKGYRNEYRWWCAFDLSRRLVYAAIYIFVPDWTIKKVLFIFFSVFIFITHAIVGPYKKNYANYGESFLLGILTLIAALQALPDSEKNTRNTASIIALAPTIVYTIVIVVHLSVNRIRKCKRGFLRRKADGSLRDSEGKIFPIPKRVLFERPVFRSNRRGSDNSDDDKTIEQPSVGGSPPEEQL